MTPPCAAALAAQEPLVPFLKLRPAAGLSCPPLPHLSHRVMDCEDGAVICWLSSHYSFPTSLSLLTVLIQGVVDGVESRGWQRCCCCSGQEVVVTWAPSMQPLQVGVAVAELQNGLGSRRQGCAAPEQFWQCVTQLKTTTQSCLLASF